MKKQNSASQPPIPNGEKTIQGEESAGQTAMQILADFHGVKPEYLKLHIGYSMVERSLEAIQEYATLKTTSLQKQLSEKDEEISELKELLARTRRLIDMDDHPQLSKSINEALTNKP